MLTWYYWWPLHALRATAQLVKTASATGTLVSAFCRSEDPLTGDSYPFQYSWAFLLVAQPKTLACKGGDLGSILLGNT